MQLCLDWKTHGQKQATRSLFQETDSFQFPDNRPERSEHARRDRCPVCTEGKTIPSCATGVEPAGDHQWWAVFFDINFIF